MNPVLRELGFSPFDRVVVVHADDIGMCESTLPALEALLAVGVVTSASAMVPCPAFPEVVSWRQRHSEVDLGVHLTLTSEWDRYRWGPISCPAADSGLVDRDGHFHRTRDDVRTLAAPAAVQVEMQAQVAHARQLGLAPSHLDCHMMVAQCDEFHSDYFELGCQQSLPVFFPHRHSRSAIERARLEQQVCHCRHLGMPVFDHYQVATRRPHVTDQPAFVSHLFATLPPGLSCVLLHPAIDTAEVRRMTDQWPARVADFEVFRDPILRNHIHNLGIELISYQPLRDVMLRLKQMT